MLEVPVYSMSGDQAGSVQIDPAILGDRVRPALLKQAIVMYRANLRQNTVATRSRGMVSGSTRKLYRQKGTGNARMGSIRTNVRRGGGMAFAKGKQVYSREMPKKMRRLARNNAILAKIVGDEALVIDDLAVDAPKTSIVAKMLTGVGASDGCLLAVHERDENLLLSGRNIPKTEIRLVGDLNAYDILRRKKLIFSKPAFEALVGDPVSLRPAADTSSE